MQIKKITRNAFIFLTMLISASLITACDNSSDTWSNLYGVDEWTLWSSDEFSIESLSDGGSILFVKGWGNYNSVMEYDNASFVIKLDKDGAIVWQKRISDQSESNSVRVTESGDIYIGGRFSVFDGSGVYTSGGYTLMKMNTDGAVLWKKQYATAHPASMVDISLDETRGMVYVKTMIAAPAYSTLLAKVTMDGELQWQKSLNSSSDGAIIVSPDGGCVIGYGTMLISFNQAGQVSSCLSYAPLGGSLGLTAGDSYTIRTIAGTADGCLIAGGVSNKTIDNERKHALSIMKIGANGAVTWSGELLNITETPPNEDSSDSAGLVALRQTSDGGYALIGNRSRYQYYEYSLNYHHVTKVSGWMMKFDSAWNISWQKIYNEKAQFIVTPEAADRLTTYNEQVLRFGSFDEAPDGGFVIAGELFIHALITTQLDAGHEDPALVIKTSGKGAVANTQLIIKKMGARIGAISISAAAASCPVGDVPGVVSDATFEVIDAPFFIIDL